jgi:hypothetical protein
MTIDKWSGEEDRLRNERRGPTRSEMEADLRRAVLNTGGTLGKGAVDRPTSEPVPAAPQQLRAIGKVAPAAPPKPVVSERRRKHEDLKAEGLRAIDAASLTPVEPETVLGEKPRMAWIALASLRIDDRYQRNVLEVGLRNVYHIARHFDWRKFAPVIVAEIGDTFAVVDGQHRCYAAALRGIKDVPCLVIKATLAEQAAAFAAINGKVTRISELHVHAAAVTAGESAAVELHDACEAAGVAICRYPVPENKMLPGQTLAIGALRQCLKTHGADALRLALQCIMAAHRDAAGALRAPLIRALCEVIAGLNGERRRHAISTASGLSFINLTSAARVSGAQNRRAVHVELFDALLGIFDPAVSK